MSYATAVRSYQEASASAAAGEASAHQLVAMLYAGAQARLATARGAIARGDVSGKLKAMSAALAIIEHLQVSLDHYGGGEIAARLQALYEYMQRRLLHANVANDAAAVDEVLGLLRSLSEGWNGIARQV
ncbi:flagellar protein FliS [Solimonas aquatica]|uniref:Flagellar secretion chaperone FliS n=1 Tax=Solimonas aquatica TaxID=489703 RepID=A0A1H9HIV4_9GAMM|nr:flagellar export chaperone FliS [Solimonas aquatica]SEQ62281.1 flagellar protein FliS [Solimonas aquatica]